LQMTDSPAMVDQIRSVGDTRERAGHRQPGRPVGDARIWGPGSRGPVRRSLPHRVRVVRRNWTT
jgi:hypothetical protein